MAAPASTNPAWNYLTIAWLAAIVATLSVLFIGEVMQRQPCVLCWYQRAFMFPLAVVLGIASYRDDPAVWRYGMPLAGIGLAIAAYHLVVFFELFPQAIQPCGAGPSCSSADMSIFTVVPLPALSLAAFSIILFLLNRVRQSHPT